MIDPISAVAINPTSMNPPTTQNMADSSNLSTSWSSGPDVLTIRATDMTASQSANPLTNQSLANLSNNVHGGLENFNSHNTQTPMQIENKIIAENMKSVAPTFDGNGEKISATSKKDSVQGAIVTLEKTFDHAIFSAMVTQVASGVSNSVRMLARQS